jgi:hypothetical protein
MIVLARYHGERAVVAPRYPGVDGLTERQAKRIAHRMRERFRAVPGVKFWVAEEPPETAVGWLDLRAQLDAVLADPPPPKPLLLSEKGAGQRLGLSIDQIRREVNAGRLTCRGPRSKRRFEPEELDRYAAAQK